MAKLISGYIDTNGIDLASIHSDTWTFTDIEKVPDWAREYVEQMRIFDILRGDQNGNFNPYNSATRAEAATVFMRLDRAISREF